MSKKLKFTLIMTLITIIAIFVSAKYILRSFKEPIDMYSEDFDITKDYIGERIEGDVPFSAGQCAQLTKTSSRKGFKTTSETYYYAIPVNGADPEYYYYICVEVKENNIQAFNTLATHFFLGSYGSHKIEGTLTELDDEIYDYTIDYFKTLYPDMSEEELKEYVRPICFELENYSNAKIALIFDIVLLIITITLWTLFITAGKKTKIAVPNEMTNIPVAMDNPSITNIENQN